MKKTTIIKIFILIAIFCVIPLNKTNAQTEVNWNITATGTITVPQYIVEEFCEGISSPTGCFRDGMYKNIYPATTTSAFQGEGWTNSNNEFTKNLENFDSGDGNYWYWFGSHSLPPQYNYWIQLKRESGIWSFNGNAILLTTRIITTTPANDTTISSSTNATIGATGNVNENDWTGNEYLKIKIENNSRGACQGTGLFALESCENSQATKYFEYEIASDTFFSYSSTTPLLATGDYKLTASIITKKWYWFDKTITSTTTNFTVNQKSLFDVITGGYQASTTDFYNPLNTEVTAEQLNGQMCNPINSQFDISYCTNFLFRPNSSELATILTSFKENAGARFPLGYITDFIDVISTTTVSSLPLINATIPNGIIGAGSHIELNLTNSLDYILNATTSQYTNSSASSTETLFEITNRYWSYIIYFFTGLYIISRLMGSHLIPSNPLNKRKKIN